MAIKLTCPGCRDGVQADEADRGKKIKCGTCWSDVDVPAPAAQAKAAPLPTARAVPATPVPTAKPVATAAPAPASGPRKATPLPAAAPAAKPVVATALPAAAPKPATPVASKPKPKPKDEEPDSKKNKRFQDRDRDDDDDDDDRSNGKVKKGGGGGVLIAFICIGAVMLMGVAGGIAVIVMNNGSGTAAATTTPVTTPVTPPPPNVNPVGGGGPIQPRNPGDFNPGPGVGGGEPLVPPRPPVARPQGWAEFRGKDFTCEMPVGVNKVADTFTFATRDVTGTAYTAGEPNNAIKVTVKEVVLPAGTSATSSAFVAAAFGVPEADLKKDPAGRLVSGNPGVEYTSTTADGYDNAILTVGVGTKNAFLFRYQWKPNTPAAAEKRDNFFASVNVLLEGDVPVARDPFGGRPDPRQPKPITRPWVQLENKDGFDVQLPPGATKGEKQFLEAENRTAWVGGKKWTADDGDVAYHVFCHDLAPDKIDLDMRKIASPLVRAVFPHEVNTEEVAKVDGKAGVRWNIRHFHGGMSHGVSVRVGYRVFTFFCTSKQGIHSAADATLTEREDKFLNSIKITFDPKTHNPYADEPEWVAMKATLGFTALIPKQATTEHDFKPRVFDYKPGREWRAEVEGITYQAFAINITPPLKKTFNDPDLSPTEVAKHAFGHFVNPESGPNKGKMGNGLDAEEWTLKGDHGPNHVRQVVTGKLVFTLKTTRSGWDNKVGDKEYADKSAKFFASFRLGDVVAQPGELGVGGGGVVADANTGEFVKFGAARVQPFWAGVFLAQKKEFVTFGVKDATARPVRGVVRRYSVPDFKLKATYETTSPINRVTADEANGRLFAATVQQAAAAKAPEKDNLFAVGDVQQYDLLKLIDGSLTDGDKISPVNTLQSSNSALFVSGLEAAADGSAVYISAVTVSGKAPQAIYRGKLLKWEVAGRKMEAEIVTDAAIGALALSADGKKVIAIERGGDVTRPSGNLLVIDGPAWKRSATVPLTGLPVDVAFRSDRAAVIVSPGQGQAAKLFVGPTDGEMSETTPGGEVNCVRFTPGGTKLLVSAGVQASGLSMFDVGGGKPPKLTKAAAAGEMSGMFVVSADGKIAVMNTGGVLDLEKSKPK